MDSFYRRNGFLFWLLGISIAVISIIYGVNADIIRQYNNENLWEREFLIKQILLEKLNQSLEDEFEKTALEIIKTPCEDIHNSTKFKFPQPSLEEKEIRTLIVIDKTSSVEDKLYNLLKKQKADEYMDSILECLKNLGYQLNSLEAKNNTYFSASAIIALSFFNNLKLKSDSKVSISKDKISLAFYYTEETLKLINQDSIGSTIWDEYSEFEKGKLKDFLGNFHYWDNYKVSDQKTIIASMFKEMKTKIIDDFNDDAVYHIILLSDFIDDRLLQNDNYYSYISELEEAVKDLRGDRVVQLSCVHLSKSEEAYKNSDLQRSISELNKIFTKEFSGVKYYFLDTESNDIFQNEPNEFAKRTPLITKTNNTPIVVFNNFNIPNHQNVSIGFIKDIGNKTYAIKNKTLFQDPLDYFYAQGDAMYSTHLQPVASNIDAFKPKSTNSDFVSLILPNSTFHTINSSLFLEEYSNKENTCVEKPIVFKGRLSKVYIAGFIIFYTIFLSSLFSILFSVILLKGPISKSSSDSIEINMWSLLWLLLMGFVFYFVYFKFVFFKILFLFFEGMKVGSLSDITKIFRSFHDISRFGISSITFYFIYFSIPFFVFITPIYNFCRLFIIGLRGK